MKNLLIIALLSLPIALFGQPDSLPILSDDGFEITPVNFLKDTLPARDTVQVILIVIDTSTGVIAPDAFAHPLDHARNDRRIPFWIKAFSVREKHNSSEGINDAGMTPWAWQDYMKHLYYLDEHKRALSKDFIVIQTINL